MFCSYWQKGNKKSVKLDCFPLFKVFGVTHTFREIVQPTPAA